MRCVITTAARSWTHGRHQRTDTSPSVATDAPNTAERSESRRCHTPRGKRAATANSQRVGPTPARSHDAETPWCSRRSEEAPHRRTGSPADSRGCTRSRRRCARLGRCAQCSMRSEQLGHYQSEPLVLTPIQPTTLRNTSTDTPHQAGSASRPASGRSPDDERSLGPSSAAAGHTPVIHPSTAACFPHQRQRPSDGSVAEPAYRYRTPPLLGRSRHHDVLEFNLSVRESTVAERPGRPRRVPRALTLDNEAADP